MMKLMLFCRFCLKNIETGDIEQYDLGHGLVPKINEINKERVLKRRQFKSPTQDNESYKIIEKDLQEMKSILEQIKNAVL